MRKRGAAASAAWVEGSSSSWTTHEHEKLSNAVAKATVATAPRSPPPTSKLVKRGRLVIIAIHIFACLVYITGLWLRLSFHSGQECDMTYSYPNFIPIATTANTTKNKNNLSQNYRLYKFVDGRDPRYQELLSHPQPVKDNQHCFGSASGPQRATTTTFVLYIPGHEGSYTQARSLGAHGTSWTHAQHDVRPGQRALRKGHYWRGGSGDGSNDNVGIPLSQFVYEVYAVDFAEQGGALHGNYLKAQSDYVVHVLQYLQEACQVVSSEIQVVAHSMGGYVAKLALAQLSSRAASGGGIVVAQNVITLATPHNNPLYAFDETIHEVHHQEISNNIPSKNSSTSRRHENENDTDNNNVLWISISGGLRDEMIAPEACEIPTTPTDNSNSLSYLASDWLTKTRPKGANSSKNKHNNNYSYGMDHRAIVWCHSVLEQVRRTIWTLAQSKVAKANVQERRKRVQEVLGVVTSYSQQLATMKAQFQAEYGILPSFAMQCAMLYNLPLLYTIHVILAALHSASSSTYCMPWVMVVFLTATLDEDHDNHHHHHHHHTMSIPMLGVLTLVASSIHFLLVAILKRLAPLTDRILFTSSWRFWMGADAILVALGTLAMTTTIMKGHFLMQAMIFLTGILAICVASISIRPTPLGAMILLATPGVMAGISILAIHQGDMEPRSWWIWLRFVGPVLAIRSIQSSSSWRRLSHSAVAAEAAVCEKKGHDADSQKEQDPYPLVGVQVHRIIRATLIVGILHWKGSNLLTRGHAYEVVDLVYALLLWEILSLFCFYPLLQWMVRWFRTR